MKKSLKLICLLLACLAVTPEPLYARIGIQSILPKTNSVKQYELFELSLSLDIPQSNPFMSEDINLIFHVMTPSGKKLSIPAYFEGNGTTWKARFTPTEVGKYSYFLRLKSPRKNYDSYTYNFDVNPGDKNGFLRISPNNTYLVFDSGKPFFGIGHNVAWVKHNEVSSFEDYFKLLNENGCNLTRIWLNNPWTIGIETRKLGTYNITDSNKLDSILNLAEKYGIYIILVLDSYGSLMEDGGSWDEAMWKNNPYNKLKGGPCEKPEEFFTNKEAKRAYKNRLRYIIGRWSYSPNIVAFELWNEMDIPYEWLKEMTSYIKEINPHGELITTSLGYPWGNIYDDSKVWEDKNISLVNGHIWGDKTTDITGYIVDRIKLYRKKYKKCVILSEFGMNTARSDKDHDPQGSGTALHNSIWASSLSGAAATALNWWWEDYIVPNNLYSHYQAIGKFLKDVKWTSDKISYPEISMIIKNNEKNNETFADMTLKTIKDWERNEFNTFTIMNNGYISGGIVNYYLHGITKKNLRVLPEFTVNYPEDGKFIIMVDKVSQDANLEVFLDGKKVYSKHFPTGPGEGPWQKSEYLDEYGIYQCTYNSSHEIEVPRGQHTISLSNSGIDWLGIKEIKLPGYLDKKYIGAVITGVNIGEETLLWILNNENDWRNIAAGKNPSTIRDAFFTLSGIEDGEYKIEWWDTYTGEIKGEDVITAINNKSKITIPPFSKDIAAKIRKISSFQP